MEVRITTGGEPSSVPRPVTRLDEARSDYQHQAGMQRRYQKTSDVARNDRLAKGLGWFSIGLGVAQLLAPRAMSRASGMSDHPFLMRAVGVREIAAGVGILSQREPTPWLWTRVAGDAMDLTMLGVAAASPGTQRRRVAAATAAVAGVTVLDIVSSLKYTQQKRTGVAARGVVDVVRAITVNHPAIECYRFWRDFENFPRFMKHVESVQVISDTRSHWKAKGPAGTTIEWDAEITEDRPGELLAWRSLENADVENTGRVSFQSAPGGRGTIVRVEMQYRPPGGKAGVLLAKLFGEEPGQQIEEDLRRFKQLIETGEIPTTVGQPSGRRDPITRLLFRKGKPG